MLVTLLSQALVALTIEIDNEFEARMPHRTTDYGASAGAPNAPWLVSAVMWWNCMRCVAGDGVSVGELERLARTSTNLAGMERWGYVTIEPDPAPTGKKPRPSSRIVRPTRAGESARKVWPTVFPAIEQRWRQRFGASEIDRLAASLRTLVDQSDDALPDCLPILEYGLFTKGPTAKRHASLDSDPSMHDSVALFTLLSRALLLFATDYERDSRTSLAIGANVLRVLDEPGVPLRDLPRISGVSKASINIALGLLQRSGAVAIERGETATRGKTVRLTAAGRAARSDYQQRIVAIEAHWHRRFGDDVVGELRRSLDDVAGDSSATSLLIRGTEPPAGGWRTRVQRPDTLPHFPMVLHRGGFPDGS